MYWKDSALYPYFDGAVFSCQAGLLKPDPEIYHCALRKIGCVPEECVFIGDGGSQELMGAKAVGMTTVLSEFLDVKPEAKRKDILKYADYTITDFLDLLNVLEH